MMFTQKMRLRFAALSGVLLWSAAAAQAGDGQFEISRRNVPITLTNAGSYVVTEDLYLQNGELIAAGAAWKYFDKGSLPDPNWYGTNYDDSAWSNGVAEFGYGDNNSARTTVSYGPNANSKYVTTYFRTTFVVTNKPAYGNMDLFVRRDDGVVVYLNGVEVLRDNMPGGTISYSTLASSSVPNVDANAANGDPETLYYEFYVNATNLVNGTNVMAAELHQAGTSSSDDDTSFDLGLNVYTNGSGDPTNAITIAANNVTVDLHGHLLLGNELATKHGIEIINGVEGAMVRNGTVANWGNCGIYAGGATGCIFREIRAYHNFVDGINTGDGALIENCVSTANGRTASHFERGQGFNLNHATVANRCIAYDNYNHGFLANSGCDVSDCLGSRNSHDGLHGGASEVIARFIMSHSPLAADGKAGEGIEIEVGTLLMDSIAYDSDDGIKTRAGTSSTEGRALITRCSAYSNANDGIKSERGAMFIRCNAYDNGDDGITMIDHGVAMYNMSANNGFRATGSPGGGVYMEGVGNFAAFNHAIHNETGVAAAVSASLANLIVGNSASRNLGNFRINAGNISGNVTNNPNAAGPWANFRLGN